MKVGDLVKADSWLENIGGKLGVIIFVQDIEYCASAQVLFDAGVTLIRLDNLRLAYDIQMD
jgi:hypothetical protein